MTMTDDHATADILDRIQSSTRALEEIAHLEIAGRSILLMVSAHMNEITRAIPGEYRDQSEAATQYYILFYDDRLREFFQQDDVAFVTHHCNRLLFQHWQEEMEELARGVLGKVLSGAQLSLPELAAPTPKGMRAIAGYWYDDVRKALEVGRLPPEREQRNPVMTPEECETDELQAEYLWLGALKWIIEVWGEQAVLMWRIVRDTIAVRREADLRGEEAVRQLVDERREQFEAALKSYGEAYERWRERHVGTLEFHFPLFRKFLVGFEDWCIGRGEEFLQIPIMEPLKDELYLEVATTVAELRGEPLDVELPAFTYWRTNPWTPASMAPGAPGMPPFTRS